MDYWRYQHERIFPSMTMEEEAKYKLEIKKSNEMAKEQCEIKVGDKIASDDYCAIGILREIFGELYVVGDFGTIKYDEHSADWELYDVWIDKQLK